MGDYAEQILKPNCLEEVLKYFDTFLKVEFRDDESIPFFNIPIPGAPNIPEIGIEDGFMIMTTYILER